MVVTTTATASDEQQEFLTGLVIPVNNNNNNKVFRKSGSIGLKRNLRSSSCMSRLTMSLLSDDASEHVNVNEEEQDAAAADHSDTDETDGTCSIVSDISQDTTEESSDNNIVKNGRKVVQNAKNSQEKKNGTKRFDSDRRRRRRRHRDKERRRQRNDRKQQQQQSTPPEPTEEEKAQYVAMDCEMVGVGHRGRKSALARVTVVDWNGCIILDRFVKPQEPVVDYRTFVSGITSQDLEGDDAWEWEYCRSRVLQLLRGKVLVGHALKNDLHALDITHPWQRVRDTAKYEAFMKVRFESDGILWPRRLRELAREYLARDIQPPGVPHSAAEDAGAAMELYRSVRPKWEKIMDYKINRTKEILQKQQQQQQQPQ